MSPAMGLGTTCWPCKSFKWASFLKNDFLTKSSASATTCSGSATSGIFSLLDFLTCTFGAECSWCKAVYMPNDVDTPIIPIAMLTGTKSPFCNLPLISISISISCFILFYILSAHTVNMSWHFRRHYYVV